MNIGAQLYAYTRETLEANLTTILSDLKTAGYTSVEGSPGHDVDYRDALDALGMTYNAPHIVPPALNELDQLIAYVKQMGGEGVVSSGPIEWNERSVEDYSKTATFLNEKGQQLADAGLTLYYHNHEFEFETLSDGRTAMELLMDETDSSCVSFCFDAGWACQAKIDPVAFMNSHGDRIRYVHLRDFKGDAACPLGQGDINNAPILAAAKALPELRHLVIEHDPGSETTTDDLRVSIEHVKALSNS